MNATNEQSVRLAVSFAGDTAWHPPVARGPLWPQKQRPVVLASVTTFLFLDDAAERSRVGHAAEIESYAHCVCVGEMAHPSRPAGSGRRLRVATPATGILPTKLNRAARSVRPAGSHRFTAA